MDDARVELFPCLMVDLRFRILHGPGFLVGLGAGEGRDTILATAINTFSPSGPDASLEGIDRQAGVGIGTLYLHFPTREALAIAAYQHEVKQLCDNAEELHVVFPPDQAMREWMGRFVGYVAAKRGMALILRTILSPEMTTSQISVRRFTAPFCALPSRPE